MGKKFVYLVLCESKLPSNLKDLTGGNSDVIFLSWKKAVRGGIFFPCTTWTRARNRLFKEVLDKDYDYYIFMDDDIALRTTNSRDNGKNPWRLFEKYLLRYKPAVGFPHNFGQRLLKKEVDTPYCFDACINAIEKGALKVLLPYCDLDDKKSWHYSQVYFFYLACMLYPGQVMQFNSLATKNSFSRAYPRHNEPVEFNKRFEKTILDKRIKLLFKPYLNSFSNGKLKVGKNIRVYRSDELARFFDMNSNIFQRINLLRDYVYGRVSYGKVYGRFSVSNLADILNRNFGPSIANLLMFLPIYFNQLVINYSKFHLRFDSFAGKFGLFLKNHLPRVYHVLGKSEE